MTWMMDRTARYNSYLLFAIRTENDAHVPGHTHVPHTRHPDDGNLAQKRMEGRLTYASFLWTRRILERLQAIQNQ
jgi:hypothetical protein